MPETCQWQAFQWIAIQSEKSQERVEFEGIRWQGANGIETKIKYLKAKGELGIGCTFREVNHGDVP